MIYRRRASPLHAARAGAGCAYCLALALAALLLSAPWRSGPSPWRSQARPSVPAWGGRSAVPRCSRCRSALIVMAVNMLVAQGGLTVIARLGDLPVFGQTDVTLEATVYGAVLGAAGDRAGAVRRAVHRRGRPRRGAGLFRRFSFHSALTATLATRMVPVLARDARRLAEAQRCRPGPPPSRARLMRATTAGVLDRALDVAAALEVRGYGAARRPGAAGRARPPPYSRHDIAFGASAVAMVSLAVGARIAGLVPFSSDPSLYAPVGTGEVAVAVAIVACALLPFADRRGIER